VPLYGHFRPTQESKPIDARSQLEQAALGLPGFFAPVEVSAFLPSTMLRAAELAEQGAPEGATVLTDHQTAGRGRLGRSWIAPPGSSLMLSVVLRPALPPARAWLVVAAAGVALVEAAGALLGRGEVALKWPNDLLVGGRKAAGLLAESRAGAVLLGMGVNVGQTAGDFPPELRERVTSLSLAAGRPMSRAELLAAWAPAFADRYGSLATGAGGVLGAWRRHLATLGGEVRVERLADRPVVGRAIDVGEGGELLVRQPDGAEVLVAAGDVEHLRPEG
jgi:BirA family transcriptional regulator, biotin operon repressor / biotin---[acetyl-CoA-carboxylase] ligase